MNQNNELPKVEGLIEKVRRVFADAPYPGDENIIGKPDHVAECSECKEWETLLRGRKWEDYVENECGPGDEMIFVSATAWHYFLPAQLIEGIRSGDFSYFLLEREAFSRSRHLKLSSMEQCRVVREYLQVGLEIHQRNYLLAPKYQDAIAYWEEIIELREVWEREFDDKA